jgi:ribosomal protein S18 acetylase RimI-like enzyme
MSGKMASIVKATEKDIELLAKIGALSLVESHGRSAPAADLNKYLGENYTPGAFKNELNDIGNLYYIIYHKDQPAGYSKINFNASNSNIQSKKVTKLERLYLLQEFYSLGLGFQLLQFNIDLSRENNQEGMWLYVWKENDRAVNFYRKMGFTVIGSYDFRFTETHSNPNHQMFLKY